MFNIKNKLILDPSAYTNVKGDLEIKEIIEPISKNLPEYWKGLRVKEDRNIITAKTCPSFIELFKNSYVLKSPVEMVIGIDPQTRSVRWKSSDKKCAFISFHDYDRQLFRGKYNRNLGHLKFTGNWAIKPTKEPFNLVFLDSIFYQSLKIKVLPGVLNVSNKFANALNINFYFDWREFNKKEMIKISKGQILAVVYSPSGIIPIKKGKLDFPLQRYFLGNFLKRIKDNV